MKQAPNTFPWINVADRLPRDSPHQHYTVCVRNKSGHGRAISLAVYSGGKWRFVLPHDRLRLSSRVTHWMRVRMPPRDVPAKTTISHGGASK